MKLKSNNDLLGEGWKGSWHLFNCAAESNKSFLNLPRTMFRI